MCDNCNCSIHLRCYKNDKSLRRGIPRGDWFCQRCKQKPTEAIEKTKCMLCGEKEGLLIQCNVPGNENFGVNWLHEICVNEHPYLRF